MVGGSEDGLRTLPASCHQSSSPDSFGFTQAGFADWIVRRRPSRMILDEKVRHEFEGMPLVAHHRRWVQIPPRIVDHRIEDGLPALVPVDPNHSPEDPPIRAECEQGARENPPEQCVGVRMVEVRDDPAGQVGVR